MKTYSYAELSQRPGCYYDPRRPSFPVIYVTVAPGIVFCLSPGLNQSHKARGMFDGLSDVSDQYDLIFDGPKFTGVKRRIRQYTAAEALKEPGVYRCVDPDKGQGTSLFIVPRDGGGDPGQSSSNGFLYLADFHRPATDPSFVRQPLSKYEPFTRVKNASLEIVQR